MRKPAGSDAWWSIGLPQTAALEEEIALSAVPLGARPDGLLGMEQGDETDQLLVTESGGTVTLSKNRNPVRSALHSDSPLPQPLAAAVRAEWKHAVRNQFSDQKPWGAGWSAKQGQTITCPAAHNCQSGEHVVAHAHRVLRFWNNEDVNLDTAFKSYVAAQHIEDNSTQGTFREGATRGLEALPAEPQQKTETLTSDNKVIMTKFFMVSRHPVLIFITEKHGHYFAYVQMFNSCALSKYTLLLGQEEKSVIQSCTASVGQKFISLKSLSSDGCIHEILIPIHLSDPENESQRVVRSRLLKTVISGNAPSGAALTVLDRDHTAVLGPPLAASGKCLSIGNTAFQTLPISEELPQGTSGPLWYYEENSLQGTDVNLESVSDDSDAVQGGKWKSKPNFFKMASILKKAEWSATVLGLTGEAPQHNASRRFSSICVSFIRSAAEMPLQLLLDHTLPPALSRTVAWTGLLLEAGFAAVATIPEAKGLLLSLYKFVKSQPCI
ncbi:LOW QUALITY PROTEIN: nucleolar protein 11-like [Glossophaga mutica]